MTRLEECEKDLLIFTLYNSMPQYADIDSCNNLKQVIKKIEKIYKEGESDVKNIEGKIKNLIESINEESGTVGTWMQAQLKTQNDVAKLQQQIEFLKQIITGIKTEELENKLISYICDIYGLEKCDFDDECDFCKNPEGGSWAALYHVPEDVTETRYYICRKCILEERAK